MEIKNLCFSYENNIIFDKLNLNFEDNNINFIIGKSGVGKSTLLKCIAGLLKYKGEIYFKNTLIDSKDIFMVNQSYTNFPWLNCLNNVLFPIKIDRKPSNADINKALEVLTMVGLDKHMKDFPMELSNGMQQKLILARMLFLQPKILLMDEPLSYIDETTKSQMLNLILNLHEDTKNTIIFVTHDINEAKALSDNIVKL